MMKLLKTGKSKNIEYRLERLGMLWLLYKAHNENVIELNDSNIQPIAASTSISDATSINFLINDKFNSKKDQIPIYQNKLIKKDGQYFKYEDLLKEIKSNMDDVSGYKNWFYSKDGVSPWKYTSDSDFITAGELSYTMGMIYDWVYNDLSENERKKYAEAIKEKGIDAGNRWLRSITMQAKLEGNWNANNFGGVAVAALSIYDEKPEYLEICAKQISDAVRFMPINVNQFYPDGVYHEGLGYTEMVKRYMSYLLSSLKYTVNDDYGLMSVKGLEESMNVSLYVTGVNNENKGRNLTYNYSDSNGNTMASSLILWYLIQKADYDKAPILAWFKKDYCLTTDYTSAGVNDLLWWPLVLEKYGNVLDEENVNKKINEYESSDELKTVKFFSNDNAFTRPNLASNDLMSDKIIYGRYSKINLLTIRQSFTDVKSSFFGVVSTDSNSSHKDLDTGSFVFDALGERWAYELGRTSSYNVDRYKCYVKRAEGHNTLVINPKEVMDNNYESDSDFKYADQNFNKNNVGKCDFTKFADNKEATIAVLDMTNAYTGFGVESAQRGFMSYDNKSKLIIQDEIEFKNDENEIVNNGNEVYWFLHPSIKGSEATIQILDNTSASLTKNGKQMKVIGNVKGIREDGQIDTITGAEFKVMNYECLSDTLQAYEENSKNFESVNYQKLALHLNNSLLRYKVDEENYKNYNEIRITVALIPIYDDDDIYTEFEGSYSIKDWENTANYIGEGTNNQITSMKTQSKMNIQFNSLNISDLDTIVSNPVYINDSEASLNNFEWESSNSEVVTINESGQIIPKNYGKCEVTVTSKENPGLTKTFTVSVKKQYTLLKICLLISVIIFICYFVKIRKYFLRRFKK